MSTEITVPNQLGILGANHFHESTIAPSLVNIAMVNEAREKLVEIINRPFEEKTPKTKVKRRPDGYDYVSGSYMASKFKEHNPLYEYTELPVIVIHRELLYITATVRLRSRVTGNTEVGAGAARITISVKAKELFEKGQKTSILPFDLIDLDSNVKSALEEARKNAEREFGIAADIFRRQEVEPTKEQQEAFDQLIEDHYGDDIVKRQAVKEQWLTKTGSASAYDEMIEKIRKKYEVAVESKLTKSGQKDLVELEKKIENGFIKKPKTKPLPEKQVDTKSKKPKTVITL
jgi:hypothetical protein